MTSKPNRKFGLPSGTVPAKSTAHKRSFLQQGASSSARPFQPLKKNSSSGNGKARKKQRTNSAMLAASVAKDKEIKFQKGRKKLRLSNSDVEIFLFGNSHDGPFKIGDRWSKQLKVHHIVQNMDVTEPNATNVCGFFVEVPWLKDWIVNHMNINFRDYYDVATNSGTNSVTSGSTEEAVTRCFLETVLPNGYRLSPNVGINGGCDFTIRHGNSIVGYFDSKGGFNDNDHGRLSRRQSTDCVTNSDDKVNRGRTISICSMNGANKPTNWRRELWDTHKEHQSDNVNTNTAFHPAASSNWGIVVKNIHYSAFKEATDNSVANNNHDATEIENMMRLNNHHYCP